MPGQLLPVLLCLFFSFASAQDSLYTRKILKQLTSKKCYGRGYLNKGLRQAEKIIVKELKSTGTIPLFDGSYTQSFYHTVNTFPAQCVLKINGKELKPGYDFIPSAFDPSRKGTFKMRQVDSVTYCAGNCAELALIRKNKLTYTVGNRQENACVIELDRNKVKGFPDDVELDVKAELLQDFESRNISAFINGQQDDSLIVFTAHYDHLGGIGKKTFFPGANDNASGVSMLLNLIKHYKKTPPKYRTLFIFFAGEEAGLLGSKHFVESGAIDLKKIKFLINLDLLGTGDEGIMVVNGAVYQKEFERLEQLNASKRLLPQVKKRGKAANSDHYWFTEKGVPAFFIYTMGGIKAYHDVYDIEKTLPLSKYQEVFTLLTLFVKGL